MKNIIILFFANICLLFFEGCKKEEVPYPSESTSIYFKEALLPSSSSLRNAVDTLAMTFAFSPASLVDSTLKIPVSIQGLTKSIDRLVKLTVDPASTALPGVQYELPSEFSIRANHSTDTIFVVLHRTPDLKTAPVNLILNLEANDNFDVNMKSQIVQGTSRTVSFIRLKVIFADILTKPLRWQPYYHGPFSAKKLLLMNEIAGTPLTAFNDNNSVPYWFYWGSLMARYFEEQKAAGHTVYEADGVTEMQMGPGLPG
jgi:hypothetical protein